MLYSSLSYLSPRLIKSFCQRSWWEDPAWYLARGFDETPGVKMTVFCVSNISLEISVSTLRFVSRISVTRFQHQPRDFRLSSQIRVSDFSSLFPKLSSAISRICPLRVWWFMSRIYALVTSWEITLRLSTLEPDRLSKLRSWYWGPSFGNKEEKSETWIWELDGNLEADVGNE